MKIEKGQKKMRQTLAGCLEGSLVYKSNVSWGVRQLKAGEFGPDVKRRSGRQERIIRGGVLPDCIGTSQ